MKLHRKDIFTHIGETFVRPVIDIHKGGNCHIRIQAVCVHRIAVILGSDVHPAGLQIFDRMVAAPMSVF